MNTPNPLVPQGSLQKSREKSTVRTAFFTIAAIHVVFFGGLLIQGGCKKSEDKPVLPPEGTNAGFPPMTNETALVDTNPAAPFATNPVVEPTPPVVNPVPPVAPDLKEYVVTKGDSFSSIAKKLHVSVKAIEQANPAVNSSKLQLGQKLQVPSASAPATLSAPAPTTSSDTSVYLVKTGDTLEKIAKSHGTTVKTIMSLNSLKSTKINIGQKLKLPAPKVVEPAPAPVPVVAPATPVAPAPAPATAPVKTP